MYVKDFEIQHGFGQWREHQDMDYYVASIRENWRHMGEQGDFISLDLIKN